MPPRKADPAAKLRHLVRQMKNTEPKKCTCCSRPARYSVASVVSTVGVRPRHQKCSRVILQCENCIRELLGGAAQASSELRKSLKQAYTALNQLSSSDTATLMAEIRVEK